ncbi:dienelactone hydrolase family protein [Streptomyces sp. NPDC059002]|uniref:dienelactone hydrolase family protein n=1 Tax=Streptomyces sp. NPDC059002 TaxID=3346690 RepID=UPI00367B2214
MTLPTRTRTVQIPTADGTADAFVACPAEGGPHPGVLMYMDMFGLRPVLNGMAEHLASHGYYVVLPNVFYRHGPAPVVDLPDLTAPENRGAFFEQVGPMFHTLTAERSAQDAGAYLDFLAAQPEVRTGPAGVTGYCLGGVLAVRAAAAHPDKVAAAAGFHPGPLVSEGPDSPHLLAPRITAELHLGIPSQDDHMSPEAVEKVRQALDGAGVRHTTEVYPDTLHGFTQADTTEFSPAGLERHWDRLLALLGRTL